MKNLVQYLGICATCLMLLAPVSGAQDAAAWPPVSAEKPDYVIASELNARGLEIRRQKAARPWPKSLKVSEQAKIEGLRAGETLARVLPARLAILDMRQLSADSAEILWLRIEERLESADYEMR